MVTVENDHLSCSSPSCTNNVTSGVVEFKKRHSTCRSLCCISDLCSLWSKFGDVYTSSTPTREDPSHICIGFINRCNVIFWHWHNIAVRRRSLNFRSSCHVKRSTTKAEPTFFQTLFNKVVKLWTYNRRYSFTKFFWSFFCVLSILCLKDPHRHFTIFPRYFHIFLLVIKKDNHCHPHYLHHHQNHSAYQLL